MKRINTVFWVPLLSFFLSGCVYLVVGSVGALGGYIVSPDTVEGVADAELPQVWDTAKDVVSIMGIVESETKSGGLLNARIQGAQVTVLVTQSGSATVKVSVKARKHYLPKISLAQDIFVKIMSRLKK